MTLSSKINSLLKKEVPTLPDASSEWALQLFFIYRLFLTVTLSALFFANPAASSMGSHSPSLFAFTSLIYLGLIIASGVLNYLAPKLQRRLQAISMVLVDICAITLLMHASGGIGSGLGILIAVSIVAGSLITKGQWSELLAALASLAVLSEQVYAHWTDAFTQTTYTQAGLLGGSFFAIAILAHAFSSQLQKSEALASQRKLDLANMEQLNEYIIQHMQTGIVVVDKEGTIRLMNEASWYLLGMPNSGTGHPLKIASTGLAVLLDEWNLKHEHNPPPFHSTPGGRELSAGFSNLGEGGTLIFLEDTTSVTQQAQQLKLASLGRLTASIAHEIRNPLGAISHAEQLLKESPDLPPADHRLIDIINTNAQRVNDIIENILRLSRRDRSHPEELRLKPWLKQLIEEYERTMNSRCQQIQLKIEPDSTLIRADPSQLRQILVILLDNAIRHFKKEPEQLEIKIAGGITRESGGPYLDITDNGPGIDKETRQQIFEPFFTTQNTGTGLGLYIAKELSETNRLGLEYITLPAGGSCFRITFPARGNKPVTL